MEQKISLLELNQWIKDALNSAIKGNIWVVAEISELKENRNGHCYLELVEREENNTVAKNRAIIWSYTYRMLKPYFETSTGQLFTHGLKILVNINVEHHPVYGLSLIITDIEPAFTIGDMALQRKEIIERLKAEKVFNMNKELSLPVVPQNIAVISSKTAAGYQDFISQLTNNTHGIKFHTCLFEAYMQGDDAVPSVIHALERIFEYEDLFDVVAIIRGGGATADLSCFDNYDLALNVTQFSLPVITGIGHEKDDTIVDMVAHTRLKTPTAVAEFFISGAEAFYDRLSGLRDETVRIAGEIYESEYDKLEFYADRIDKFVSVFVRNKKDHLVKKVNRLQYVVSNYAFNKKHGLNNYKYHLRSSYSTCSSAILNNLGAEKSILERRVNEILSKELDGCKRTGEKLIKYTDRYLSKEQERILLNDKRIQLLNPVNVLKRGYTLTLSDGVIVKSAGKIDVDDEIETRFSDGQVISKIIKKV